MTDAGDCRGLCEDDGREWEGGGEFGTGVDGAALDEEDFLEAGD